MKKSICCVVLLLTGGVLWAGSGLSATYSNGFSGNLILDGETAPQADSRGNKLLINDGIFDGNLTTGQSQTGNAFNNELHLMGGDIQSAFATAGSSQTQQANDNLVHVGNVTLQSNITAGISAGNANENTVLLSQSTVNYNSATQNKVIAGETFNAQASGNLIHITENSSLNTTAMAGYSPYAGNVSYNRINVTGGASVSNTASNALYGGYTQSGNAWNNQVSLANTGTVASDVYGGSSLTGQSSYNLVDAAQSTVSADIYGGYSGAAGASVHNEVRLFGGAVIDGNIYGGYNGGTGGAEGNSVSVASGAVLDSATQLYGGYSENGQARYNSVSLQSATGGGAAYGGYSSTANAYQNTLSVSGVSQGGSFWGGASGAGVAEQNMLSIQNSTISGGAFAGGQGAEAFENKLSVVASTLNGNLYGGLAQTEADKNRVEVTDSAITGNIYGGYSNGGSASGNTVRLQDSTVTGDVYGGYSTNASASNTHNTVILAGQTTVSGNIYGSTGPSNTGNRLLLEAYQGEIKEVDSFENVTVRGLESYVGFRRDTQAVFIPYGKPSEQEKLVAYALTDGSSLTLGKDTLGAYRYFLSEGQDGTRTYWIARGVFDRHLAKPYEQAQLASLRLVSLGEEQLSGVFEQALQKDKEYDLFTTFSYGQNRYDTGSHFDMQHLNLQAGKWWKMGENAAGLFAQYARGHYSTDPVRATGSIDGFGVGGFALLPYSSSGYFKATLRGGYQENNFDSSALSSRVENEGFYLSAGGGWVQNLAWLELNAGIDWALLFDDHQKDNLGQKIRFNKAQSLMGKIGAKAELGDWGKGFKPYAELSGSYEFLAESRVRVDGHKINASDLKGLTGKAGLAIAYESASNMLPLQGKISVYGLLGQTRGFGGDIKLMFRF